MIKKYTANYTYTKTIDDMELVMVKQLCIDDDIQVAINACKKYYNEYVKTNRSDFYISEWECESWGDKTPDMPIKIREIKNVL